jgi:hypothetical protein
LRSRFSPWLAFLLSPLVTVVMSAAGSKRPSSSLNSEPASSNDAASATRRVQTRHSHSNCDPPQSLDGGAASAAPAAAVTQTVPRLHRHALESIFAFCTLLELMQVKSISKTWKAAVLSMRSIGAFVFTETPESLNGLISSPFRRHVAHLRTAIYEDPEDYDKDDKHCVDEHCLDEAALNVLTSHFPHLLSLECFLATGMRWPETPMRELWLPKSLRSITLCWTCDANRVPEDVTANVQSLISLPDLATLHLKFAGRHPAHRGH